VIRLVLMFQIPPSKRKAGTPNTSPSRTPDRRTAHPFSFTQTAPTRRNFPGKSVSHRDEFHEFAFHRSRRSWFAYSSNDPIAAGTLELRTGKTPHAGRTHHGSEEPALATNSRRFSLSLGPSYFSVLSRIQMHARRGIAHLE
jgi:hypothetical protein